MRHAQATTSKTATNEPSGRTRELQSATASAEPAATVAHVTNVRSTPINQHARGRAPWDSPRATRWGWPLDSQQARQSASGCRCGTSQRWCTYKRSCTSRSPQFGNPPTSHSHSTACNWSKWRSRCTGRTGPLSARVSGVTSEAPADTRSDCKALQPRAIQTVGAGALVGARVG